MTRKLDWDFGENGSLHIEENGDGTTSINIHFRQAPKPPQPPQQQPMRGNPVSHTVTIAPVLRSGQVAVEDTMTILDYGSHLYEVSSKSEPGAWQYVEYAPGQTFCSCLGFAYGRTCRHIRGVRKLLGHDVEAPLTWRDPAVAETFQRPESHDGASVSEATDTGDVEISVQ